MGDEENLTPLMAFGRRLRRLREERGLSRPELARQAGIDPRSLRGYENADRSSPKLEAICALAHALGVDPSYLLIGVPSRQRSGLGTGPGGDG